jgi:DNA-binding HxlR family transcriptional regulator
VAKKSVRGSRTGRPIMVLFDMLGQRWTMRILWELRDGAVTFRALRERCDDISPTELNRRLKMLREHDIVVLAEGGYAYTAWGRDLAAQLGVLTGWAERWARR